MPESPNGQIVRSSEDPAITDAHGNVWRLSPVVRGVSVNGLAIGSPHDVAEMVYAGRRVWLRTGHDNWWSKAHATEQWTREPHGPDLSGGNQAELIQAIISSKHAILMGLHALAEASDASQHALAVILQAVTAGPHDLTAAAVRFAVPTRHNRTTGEQLPMSVNIQDDVVTVIPLVFDNSAGTAVPAPSGGTATVTVDNTANFSVALSADGKSVMVTPVQPPTDGATGTITYTDVVNGQTLTATLSGLVITTDANAVSVHFDTAHLTTEPLPAPTPAPAPTPGPTTPPAGP